MEEVDRNTGLVALLAELAPMPCCRAGTVTELPSRHRCRADELQIIKTRTKPALLPSKIAESRCYGNAPASSTEFEACPNVAATEAVQAEADANVEATAVACIWSL